MAVYKIWIFILIPIFILQHLAAPRKVGPTAAKYVPQRSFPYPFMVTNPMYLLLTTSGRAGIACVKAIRTTVNRNARTLSQLFVFKSWNGRYHYEFEDYTPIWKNGKQVRGFTSFNKNTRENSTYTLHHIYKECAIVNKTTNRKIGGYRKACELWVSDQFFDRNPESLKFCTKKFLGLLQTP
uniref:Lipocalin n=1 Tax=Rhipicephalus zambeziensis TaxID=60191 RepID=A0A224YMZ9_9ACAR